VAYIDDKEFVIADIPGLIEGAHEGVGLGDRFLKHIERCKVLLHLIDGTHEDVAGTYKTIRKELEKYSSVLAAKPEIVVLNKIDALQQEDVKGKIKKLKKACGQDVLAMSSINREGLTPVLRGLLALVHPSIPE